VIEIPRVVLLLIPFAGYDRGLLQGIARHAHLHGQWAFYLSGDCPDVPIVESDSTNVAVGCTMSRGGASRKAADLRLRHLGATGVIGRISNPAIARTLLASGLPIIGIDLTKEQLASGDSFSRISEICADSHGAGRVAAEHLFDKGFRHFAFCGYPGRHWSQWRQEGFCERLQESGLACDVYEPPRRTNAMPWSREQPSLIAWLRSLPKPVGIMACNDIRGRQVIESCAAGELRVPDDVGVVGVDEDRLLCELANPPLSSVALNLERAGYQAAELLDGLMSGRIRKPQRIPVQAMWVIPRRSTDVIAIEDRHVAMAVRFVRDHFQQPITVDDVVRAARVSRRSLEIRFQRSLARSVRQEIERGRLAWCKRLLVETNLSAEKIAAAAGFNSLSYMSSVFHREMGMTLTEYRRQSRNP
jgi:LacI family transcriptional regulator